MRSNPLVPRAYGSLHSPQVDWNTETYLRPLPSYLQTATLIHLVVAHLFSSVYQQEPLNTRVLSELRPPLRLLLPVCNNNSLDYRLQRKQPSLKSSVYDHNLPAPHSANVLQQMCRILQPLPPTRITNWLRILTRNSIGSRPLYSVQRQQHRRTSDVCTAISTTYTTEDEHGIPHINNDSLVLSKGLDCSSCAPSSCSLIVIMHR